MRGHWGEIIVTGVLALAMLALACAISYLAWIMGLWVTA